MMSSADQRDFGIAVQGALRVDDCLKELWDSLAARPRLDGDEAHYYSRFSMHPHDEEMVHHRNSRDLAVELIHAAVFEKALPIWLRLERDEALADAGAFLKPDRRTWTKGFYRSDRGGTHLDGRPLWVKRADWTAFLGRLLSERYGAGHATLAAGPDRAESERGPRRRGRRPGSGGYVKSDAPLLDEMRKLIADGDASSANDAARIVAPKAKGASLASRQDRLRQRYAKLEDNGGK